MHWVFESNSPVGNVVFNFRHDPVNDLGPFARGYHEAGKRLVGVLEAAPGYRDFDGYPILFLYRHSLELYIKATICRGAQLLGLLCTRNIDTSKLFRTHQLSELLPAMKAVFDGMKWSWCTERGRIHGFTDFEKLVHGIEELDPNSFSFRYPTDKKGVSALEHHTTVNVVSFAHNMDAILEMLDNALDALQVEFDVSIEAKVEIQNTLDQMRDTAGSMGTESASYD